MNWVWFFFIISPALLIGELNLKADTASSFDFTLSLDPQGVPSAEQVSLEELAYAPLAPLETQFPLGLTQANREFLIDNPQRLQEEMQRNRLQLAAHSFPWVAIVIFILAGGIGWIAYLLRDFWPKKEAEKIKSPGPKELLEISIKKLQGSHPIKKEELKAYYGELTTILLIALQERLGIRAASLTTPELVQILKDQPSLASGIKEKMLSFLTEADLIKFANQDPLEESAQREYEKLSSLISELKI